MQSAKNELQELLQSRRLNFPVYNTESVGLQHSQSHVCSVSVQWNDECLREEGRGKKRKDAEQDAARNMLRLIRNTKGGDAHGYHQVCFITLFGTLVFRSPMIA